MAHSALRHALAGEPCLDARPTAESWPGTPSWGRDSFAKSCDRSAERAAAGWTEEQEQAASTWAAEALKTAGYAAEEKDVPEIRTKRFTEELAAVR